MKRILAVTALLAVAVAAIADPVASTTIVDRGITSEQATFDLVQLARGLNRPWSFAFLPDGDVLITERPGALWRFNGSAFTQVTGVPTASAVGQGGLLDIIVDPDHDENQYVYFSYSDRYSFGYGTVVARGRLEGSELADVEELFRMNRSSAGGRHFGSRLAFGADGMLYITLGDRGQQDRAQDPEDHAGSLVRIAPDGSIPGDNPFANGGGAPEIWSYGHRNAQGMALNPETGEIWLHEHGPQGGDEINIARRGDNYGWPVITYGVNYGIGTEIGEGTAKPGMEQPVTYWVPSIAPSGMAFYSGNLFPEWQGDIFVGALAGQHLRRVELSGDTVVSQEVLLDRVVGRIRDVRTGPDGHLYFVTDDTDGGLYRLEPSR
jgi:glucose/arabinose dehydrogenase